MPVNPKLNVILCNKNILAGRGQWRGGWRGQGGVGWRGHGRGGGGPRRRGGRRSRAAVARRRGGSTGESTVALELVCSQIMAAYQMHQEYNYY